MSTEKTYIVTFSKITTLIVRATSEKEAEDFAEEMVMQGDGDESRWEMVDLKVKDGEDE